MGPLVLAVASVAVPHRFFTNVASSKLFCPSSFSSSTSSHIYRTPLPTSSSSSSSSSFCLFCASSQNGNNEADKEFSSRVDKNGNKNEAAADEEEISSALIPAHVPTNPNSGNSVEKSQLQSSLAALSQTLAVMSATLQEVSAALQLVAEALESSSATTYSDSSVEDAPAKTPTTVQQRRRRRRRLQEEASAEPSQLQDQTANGQVFGYETLNPNPDEEEKTSGDRMPVHLTEQNARAHQLAYRLQQAFVQARIDGLGKPFQLAMDDFVMTCLEAHKEGFGLKELQLQLILLEGALSGAFAVRAQWYSDDPIMDEESRIRSSWVRLIYTTIAEVEARRQMAGNQLPPTVVIPDEKEPLDPSDGFVKEVITMTLEEGFDFERLKLEQSVAGPTMSAGVRVMRQSHYLILLTLQKILARG